MFKALKDFFKTLKMEAVGIGIRSAEGIRPPDVSVENIGVSTPTVFSEDFRVEIGGLSRSFEDVTVISEGIESEAVEVRDIWLGDRDSLGVYSVEFESSCVEVHRISALEVPEVFCEKSGFSAEVAGTTRIGVPRVVNGTREREVWIMRVPRSTRYSKTEVLDALERFLKRYSGDPKNLKFLGFYKSVPLGRAKRVWFDGNSMFLELSKKGKDISLDVIALKTDRGIELEVVVKDAGGHSRRYSGSG